MDGSPLLNMVAWASLYHDEPLSREDCSFALGMLSGQTSPGSDDPVFHRFPELLTIQRLHLNRLLLPDVALFLDIPAATACARIVDRGERRQAHETPEKLDRLRNAYLTVCEAARDPWGASVSIVNADRDQKVVLEEARRLTKPD
jgi:hypothetical protein